LRIISFGNVFTLSSGITKNDGKQTWSLKIILGKDKQEGKSCMV